MGTKEKIIAKISSIEDETYLRQILNMLNVAEEAQEPYGLSKDEERAIDEGLQDIENGQFRSREEVEELTRKWLKDR